MIERRMKAIATRAIFTATALALLLAGCFAASPGEQNPPPTERPGSGDGDRTPIDPVTPGLGGPARDAERLTIDQVSASFQTVLGRPWTITLDDGYVLPVDPLSPLYGALGGPDYFSRLAEAMDPHLLFAKLILQGAWSACDDAAIEDRALPRARRRLVRRAELDDTLASARGRVVDNIIDLKLRFHGVRAEEAALASYLELFDAASKLPAHGPLDGWRAVCVALVTEPDFVLY